MRVVRNRVADLGVAHVLDRGREESHFARRQLADFHGLGAKHAHGLDLERFGVIHHADALTFAHGPLHHPHQHNHAAIRVEPRIEDQRLQRRIRVAFGGGEPVDNRLQHLVHALAGLRAYRDRVRRIQPDRLLDGLLGAQDVSRGQVDLVDHGNDLQPVVDGQVRVRQRLRLHALACIHHQQRALARGQRTRHLVAEVHVPRRINQIELVGLAVTGFVHHAHGMGFDGDAALPLQIHIVQHLGMHLAVGHRARQFQQAVAQRRLAVIDVRNDREVAKKTGVHGRAFGGLA